MLCILVSVAVPTGRTNDWRNFDNGRVIPDEGYCDQPFVTVTQEGHWICTLTTGRGREGDPGQHIVATTSTDQGRTWSPLVEIESAEGPAASWVVPVLTPGGRIYAIYTYNGDGVKVPEGKGSQRNDMLGWYVFKYSDDNSKTWSAQRYRLPLPLAAVDQANGLQSGVQLFWGIDRPSVVGHDIVFGFTRLGKYLSEEGEGWFFRSDNLLTEPDPAKIRWQLFPDGGQGLRHENLGSIQEEFNVVPLANGDLLCFFRTHLGYAAQAYSRDGGHAWSEPAIATYTPGGQKIKTPRACPMIWRTSNGKFLLWYHNNSPYGTKPPNLSLRNRNVAWLASGVEKDGVVHWSQPEVVCYAPKRSMGVSYPDLIESDGNYFISATDKSTARTFQLDARLLDQLWRQADLKTVARRGLTLNEAAARIQPGADLPMPRLAPLNGGSGGFAIELWLQLDDLRSEQVIVDSRSGPEASGICLKTATGGVLRLELFDGKNKINWECDSGQLQPGRMQQIVFNVDVAPRLITTFIDGRLGDGGEARAFGYTRFGDAGGSQPSSMPADVSGSANLRIAPAIPGKIVRLRLYDRYLMTSEVVGNFRAGA
jgi:hypothetical protein